MVHFQQVPDFGFTNELEDTALVVSVTFVDETKIPFVQIYR